MSRRRTNKVPDLTERVGAIEEQLKKQKRRSFWLGSIGGLLLGGGGVFGLVTWWWESPGQILQADLKALELALTAEQATVQSLQAELALLKDDKPTARRTQLLKELQEARERILDLAARFERASRATNPYAAEELEVELEQEFRLLRELAREHGNRDLARAVKRANAGSRNAPQESLAALAQVLERFPQIDEGSRVSLGTSQRLWEPLLEDELLPASEVPRDIRRAVALEVLRHLVNARDDYQDAEFLAAHPEWSAFIRLQCSEAELQVSSAVPSVMAVELTSAVNSGVFSDSGSALPSDVATWHLFSRAFLRLQRFSGGPIYAWRIQSQLAIIFESASGEGRDVVLRTMFTVLQMNRGSAEGNSFVEAMLRSGNRMLPSGEYESWLEQALEVSAVRFPSWPK